MKPLPLLGCCTPLVGAALSDEDALQLEQLLKALADRHRLKIVNTILRAGGDAVCVCDLIPSLGLAQPTVSYHLKQLADAGLLQREKRGTFAFYRLAPGALAALRGILEEPDQSERAA